MIIKRSRIIYSILILIVIILGLSSRHFSMYIPSYINLYLGDILWALMIFLLFGFIFKNKETKYIAIVSILFTFFIEISQLYHSPWIDTLRYTRIGGLILGYGFLWSDLISYTIGIALGVIFERIRLIKINVRRDTQ